MAYLGNLSCRDCGLTFTARWGSFTGTDEYRCDNDHVIQASREGSAILTVDGRSGAWGSLADHRGRCPVCATELATGLLPRCPVCDGRDHDVAIAGTV